MKRILDEAPGMRRTPGKKFEDPSAGKKKKFWEASLRGKILEALRRKFFLKRPTRPIKSCKGYVFLFCLAEVRESMWMLLKVFSNSSFTSFVCRSSLLCICWIMYKNRINTPNMEKNYYMYIYSQTCLIRPWLIQLFPNRAKNPLEQIFLYSNQW